MFRRIIDNQVQKKVNAFAEGMQDMLDMDDYAMRPTRAFPDSNTCVKVGEHNAVCSTNVDFMGPPVPENKLLRMRCHDVMLNDNVHGAVCSDRQWMLDNMPSVFEVGYGLKVKQIGVVNTIMDKLHDISEYANKFDGVMPLTEPPALETCTAVGDDIIICSDVFDLVGPQPSHADLKAMKCVDARKTDGTSYGAMCSNNDDLLDPQFVAQAFTLLHMRADHII